MNLLPAASKLSLQLTSDWSHLLTLVYEGVHFYRVKRHRIDLKDAMSKFTVKVLFLSLSAW